jgi:hypothetical protein
VDDWPDSLLSIGRFAGLTGVSAKRPRHYDAIGLLSPAVTDEATVKPDFAAAPLATN